MRGRLPLAAADHYHYQLFLATYASITYLNTITDGNTIKHPSSIIIDSAGL
jgi:hypothetical protein